MEYWIDGYFDRFWNQDKVWYCHDRDVFVPKFATVRNDQENDRIYVTESYAKSILRKGREFDMTNENDRRAFSLANKINVPWKKQVYVETEERFRVSLP
ncbi:unnamed protein product [marine sediment metagenome]|uniref:Uncharacterized protein n=1 Tax=marine sediment metagenome TaxID=412755 RepID=X0TKA1_9ZZZZ